MIKFGSQDFKGFDKFREYAQSGRLKSLGIFDSGIGGLSLLKYLCSQSIDDKQVDKNNKDILYVADSGRFPYGTKSPQEIFAYTRQIIHWLEEKNVDLIVFGCNTANAIAGDKLNQISNLPIIDLIDPVAKYVSSTASNIGILATEATVSSHAFSKAISYYNPKISVTEIAAAQLVNIVEKGDITSEETKTLLANYAQQFSSKGCEIIVLGCTHFSFLKDYLLPFVGEQIQILDPAELIAQLITKCSENDDQLTELPPVTETVNQLTFFVTGDKDSFAKSAQRCLGYPLKNINQLAISDLETL